MSEIKTVQRKIRPILVRCGAPGCTTKQQDAIADERDDGTLEIIPPNGWSFPANPQPTGSVFVGFCPGHAKKP